MLNVFLAWMGVDAPLKACPEYDTKLHLMVRFQF